MAKGANILGGLNKAGEAIGGATDLLLKSGESNVFPILDTAYSTKVSAGVDGPGGRTKPIETTQSIFNPFYAFRYSKYGSFDGTQYSPDQHIDSGGTALNILGGLITNKGPLKQINSDQKIIENPTAGEIINRSNSSSEKNSTLSSMPYQWNDFLWCKWYGKMPNNRLLTLRRYPIPVEDNLQVANSKAPLVPIAQAVTWWGGETENKLDSILGMNYGFNWKTLTTVDLQNVAGNEITADQLLDAAGVTGDNLRKVLLATLFDNPDNIHDASGYDKTLQDWVKESYGSEGQYWNRVQGPINVINSTQIRDRGFKFTHTIKLKFTYKLRSFHNINPKVAMLDLITNFLSLTHNTAEFWGGGIRYFQKTGFILPGLPSNKFEKGDFIGGIEEVIKYTTGMIQEKGEAIKKYMADVTKAYGTDDSVLKTAADALGGSNTLQNLAGSWAKNLMQKPLTMRSFLDGRAVGEWHLTVGNPMNPVAVIGNLCLKDTTISFSESLGLDDFPTEVSFTVSLDPGRPRAKQDIESMFNLGGGSMSFTKLAPPSSARNSLGEANSIAANNIKLGRNDETANAKDAFTKDLKSNVNITLTNSFPNRTDGQPSGSDLQSAGDIANAFSTPVSNAYGSRFGTSPVLVDYFRDLKTKD